MCASVQTRSGSKSDFCVVSFYRRFITMSLGSVISSIA
jgi:hypothetical protein